MDLSWENDAGEVEAVTFAATVSEVIEASSTVTEHEIETGANVADHVRVQARKVRVVGLVSDSDGVQAPDHTEATGQAEQVDLRTKGLIQKSGAARSKAAVYQDKAETHTARVFRHDRAPARRRLVYETLERLRTERRLVDAFGLIGVTIPQCVITSLGAPIEQRSGDAIRFAVELSAVTFAESQIVDVPVPAEPRGRRPVDAGATATDEASGEDTESFLHSLAGL